MRTCCSGISRLCVILFVLVAAIPAMAETEAQDSSFDTLQHDLSQAFTAGEYDRASQIITKLATLVETKRASLATLDSLLIKAVAQADAAAVETILGNGARANVMNAAGFSMLAEVAAQCAGREAIDQAVSLRAFAEDFAVVCVHHQRLGGLRAAIDADD